MKILLLSDSYPPEVRSAANLMQELAEGLVQKGHEVTVLTLKPKYNLANVITTDGAFFSVTMENTVHVIRTKSLPIHNTKLIIRGLGELTLPFIFAFGSLLTDKPDIVAIYSPPLTLGLTAVILKSINKIPFLLNVQDLFPQHIIDVGLLKNPFIINFYKAIEKLIYSYSDRIVVHSEGNKKFLLAQRNVPEEKLEVIYNWVDTEIPQKINFLNFRESWGLGNKFVLFFGGVMGHTQGLEIIIDVAENLKKETDIIFLLVGDGVAKPRLQQLAKEKSLSNIIIRPFITPMEYWSLLNEINVGIITLSSQVKTPVVPSKILGYMAASKPYVASLNIESDVVNITRESKAGIFVKAGEVNDFTEAILTLYHNNKLAKEMGKNGRKYARRHFSKEVCLSQYEKCFINL